MMKKNMRWLIWLVILLLLMNTGCARKDGAGEQATMDQWVEQAGEENQPQQEPPAADKKEPSAEEAKKEGLLHIGITDHVNFNDAFFLNNLGNSAAATNALQRTYPKLILGVELTPIEMPEFEYLQKTRNREGYVPPVSDKPYGIALACTKEELIARGVRYCIGASHWRVDIPNGINAAPDLQAEINEWFRQQMFLATDDRVTVLGHPWYNGRALWYEDFSVIPHSMNLEIAHALKENGKYVECNSGVVLSGRTSEKFRHQYCDFLRELFEMGIPVTYGSDSHQQYADVRDWVEQYLIPAGFSEGDFSELSEQDLW
jgi:histidinol phosphatase-like PHP family hydrolase